jgi:hypothetical protein
MDFVKKEPSGCWAWIGSKNIYGYGRFKKSLGTRDKFIMVAAHRYSYEMHKGEIPNGLFVCPSCDNPPCVNPDHLWLGTPADNTHDMIAKGRQAKQGKAHLQGAGDEA